eukprot:CAMPEP_0194042042 /NCGR_PEP_ID=MMETSP0009_2-20130614/13836_1 /TAXON_ID=210454 /ORGANISM="Grammatophora oceanica, Strain CCMP 410" /LENGTH=90 /DNA_ID=CAMNT_0038685729 /DNA_START=871 /DNA_END=1143 /DNA_ORIENTATION=-
MGNTSPISLLPFRSKLPIQPSAAPVIVHHTAAAETNPGYPSHLFVVESTPPSLNEALLLVPKSIPKRSLNFLRSVKKLRPRDSDKALYID